MIIKIVLKCHSNIATGLQPSHPDRGSNAYAQHD